MTRRKCCIPGCFESRESHQKLHTFPNPTKDIKRFNQWVFSIGGDLIGLDNEYIFNNRSVCHLHFEEKYHCRYNRISNIAVPTLKLPGSLSFSNSSLPIDKKPMDQNQSSVYEVSSKHDSTLPDTVTSARASVSTAELFNLELQKETEMKENIGGDNGDELCETKEVIEDNESTEKSYHIKQEIFVNVHNLCRICLCQSISMVSLLTAKDNMILLDMFSSVASIKINSNDGLPLQICDVCETDVINCYQFRMKCKKANNILKSLVKERIVNINITEVHKNESLNRMETDGSSKETKIISGGIIDIKDEVNEQNGKQAEVKSEIELKAENTEVDDIEYLEESIFDVEKGEIVQQTAQNSTSKVKSMRNRQKTSTDPKLERCMNVENGEKKGKRKYYTCSICSKKFLKKTTLKLHIKTMHGKTRHPFSCGQCKESFNSEQDLHIHSALHSKTPAWTCNQCNKEFKERSKLRRHIRRHMASKRHQCDACGKAFAELCALRRHARVHSGLPPDKKYACHLCDNRYSESGALAAHISRHAGLRPCACDACGKAFPSPRLLASHRRVHSDRKPHACHYCDKRFRHESTRNTHHRTHTGDKPYVCSACGKRFIQNSNLTLHMRTHTGEKPYTCEVCERKFSSGSALVSHRRVHTGEKPYSCPICGKNFARVHLSAHIRQHTGERPFPCCVCAKRFASAARMRHHMRIHTGEKPFECAMCSEKFKTKAYLAKHLKNHEMIQSLEKRKVLVLQDSQLQPYMLTENGELVNVNQAITTQAIGPNTNETAKDDITVEVTEEMPMEVSGELILPSDGDMKTQLVVIDQGEGHGNICLSANNVNFDNNELNYTNDLNLVTVNEGEVNISSSAVLEGTTVKLYQLDQSLVQIHTSGGQVTISKITSKMTANF